MKIKRSTVAILAVAAMVVASLGLLRGATNTEATHPKPVQPFGPTIATGMGSNALGGPAGVKFDITVVKGARLTLPGFYAKGYGIVADKDMADGTTTGTVKSESEILCDGTTDLLAANDAPTYSPYPFEERTSNVDSDGLLGTDAEDYVRFNSPLWSMIVRQRSDLQGLWLGGVGGTFLPLTPAVPLNSIIMQMPWNPGADFGQVTLAGNPVMPNLVCQDSPQTSTSTNTLVSPPAAEGDSGGPCNTASFDCSEKGITRWSASPGRATAAVSAPVPFVVSKRTHNNGPEGGSFLEWWEFEAPAGVTGAWTLVGGDTSPAPNVLTFIEPPEPASTSVLANRTLTLTCTAPGSYLVALKNILYPVAPTKDQNLANNAATSMIQIECDASGSPVDKEVIWVKPTAVSAPTADSTPGHLQLVEGQFATVTVDEMKVYHAADGVNLPSADGVETLVAESVDQDLIETNWVSSGSPVLTETVSEPNGQQVDNIENLTVACQTGSAALAQPQPVVIKAIDRPGAGLREVRPGDNVTHRVIKVWCWASPSARDAAHDGIDDGTGLYLRWTSFISNPDIRKSGGAGPLVGGSPGDTDYVEYIVRPECFWIDANGSTDTSGDTYISAAESQADPDIPGGYASADSDGDCLIDPAVAQPSHKVDSNDTPTGTMCPARVFSESEGQIQVQYDTAADQDCDGLTDGVEDGMGSDPTQTDSDGDGASDYGEMRTFTNPRNPDTDYDGINDRPEDDYVSAIAGAAETGIVAEAVNADDNCPNVYNPDQTNTDGQRPINGVNIPQTNASNPNGDTQGDACDTDDDNDYLTDVAELTQTLWTGASCTFGPGGTGLNPLNKDTDGDHTVDGVEHALGAAAGGGGAANNPCVFGSTAGALSQGITALFRGGGINVPANGLYGGLWDVEHDGVENGREEDADADGLRSRGELPTSGPDVDNDDGTAGIPADISDAVEAKGWYAEPSKEDSDGDMCEDWIEMIDLDGNRQANLLDVIQVAQAVNANEPPGEPEPPTEPSFFLLDVNKDRFLTISDISVAALNSNLIFAKSHPACPSDTLR